MMVRGLSVEERSKLDGNLRNLGDAELRDVPGVPRRQKVPHWWRGDESATESSIAAARQMGFSIGSVT